MTMTGKTIADQNADLVRRGLRSLNAADMDSLIELFTENATWHTPGKSTD